MTLVTETTSARPLVIPSSLERQQWLESVVEALRRRFAEVGYAIPQKVRVTIGWPKRAATCGRIGECWSAEASSDGHAECFISPELTRGLYIVEVLAHELVHATMGAGVGHGPPFRRLALAIGLCGPMRSTTSGPEMMRWINALIARIGDYPAGFIIDTPVQGTRMQKVVCTRCGYLVRVTRKWIDIAGPPICPTDQVPLTVVQP